MAAAPDINDFISQIRFRIRAREASFGRAVERAYSQIGARGTIGAAVRKLLDQLVTDFDSQITEALTYLDNFVARTSFEAQELFQAATSELLQSAISYKALVNVDRLAGIVSIARARRLVDEQFRALDELIAVRLRDFQIGLGDKTALSQSAPVPASNRYVAITDNQRSEVVNDLNALTQEVVATNDVGDLDRQIALAEIAIFEATIMQPIASTELIERFVKEVLKFIAENFTRAAIGEIAKRLALGLYRMLAASS